MKDAQYWIERLDLVPHVEGGYFKETYRCSETIDQKALPQRFDGSRSFCTAIYFLLCGDQFSAFHRIRQDELWHFYAGDVLVLHVIDHQGNYSQIKIGPDFDNQEQLQAVIPGGSWFGAQLQSPDSFALVGCTVAPGFDFADFEIAERQELLEQYPQHRAIIEKLTR